MEVKWSENISCELLVLWNGAQVRVSAGPFFWAAELPPLSLCSLPVSSVPTGELAPALCCSLACLPVKDRASDVRLLQGLD